MVTATGILVAFITFMALYSEWSAIWCCNTVWSSDAIPWIWQHTSGLILQCYQKTFMIHQLFPMGFINILFKIVKSLMKHLGLAIGNIQHVWWFLWTLVVTQVMACCLTAPSHYLNQCWQIIGEVLWHSFEGNFRENAPYIYPLYDTEYHEFKITAAFPSGWWITSLWPSDAILGLKRYTGTPVYRGYGGTDMYRDTQKQITIRHDTFVTYTKLERNTKYTLTTSIFR